MAKQNRKDIILYQIGIMLLETLLIWLITAAERFAYYRRIYNFRQALPWLLPALAGAVAIAFAAVLILRAKRPSSRRLFSESFILCMLAPLFPVFLLPRLVLTGVWPNIFKMVTWMVFYCCIGYFVAFAAYRLIGPAAASLAMEGTLCIVGLLYFYKMYLSASSAIMNTPSHGYPTVFQNLLLFAGVLGAVTLILLILKKIPALKKFSPGVHSLYFSLLTALLVGVLSYTALSWEVRRGLIYGACGLIAVLFLLLCGLYRKRVLK